jgi:hypothetical protein
VTDLRVRIGHYRTKAADAEDNARQAKEPYARATYLQAAQAWAALAESAEKLGREQPKNRPQRRRA